jgi:hypothetical protein
MQELRGQRCGIGRESAEASMRCREKRVEKAVATTGMEVKHSQEGREMVGAGRKGIRDTSATEELLKILEVFKKKN